MNPWRLIDTAKVALEGGELRLLGRGDEFSIMLGRIELMSSRRSTSEEALATLPLEKLGTRSSARVLIGGLGMGFTLKAALRVLGADARVDVAELVPAVIAWARGPLVRLMGDSLADPRVSLHERDVGELIRSGRGAYDAILLDVDNGPDALTSAGNDALYDGRGLGAARAALRDGGILAVWSAERNDRFRSALARAGFDVEQVTVRAHGTKGTRHIIWIARRRAVARGRGEDQRR